MLEDYYGFAGRSKPPSQPTRHPRTSQRTERPPRSLSSNTKSPLPSPRSLKRTELSQKKLLAKKTQQQRQLQPPQLTVEMPPKFPFSNYHYNGDGYVTKRQGDLLRRVEERALQAFAKAAEESARQLARPVAKTVTESNGLAAKPMPKQAMPVQQQQKRYQIEESSMIRHQNSGILSNLISQDHDQSNRYSRDATNKIRSKEKVVDMSISPKKDTPKKDTSYDDYLMGVASRAKSASSHGGRQQSHKSINIFKRFQEDDDDSLLEFKPIKGEPSRKPSMNSIEMMGIHSNFKNENNGKIGLNSMDTGQLGMDTNKPGRPLAFASISYAEPILPMNTNRPSRSKNQSQVQIDLPYTGSPKQSQNSNNYSNDHSHRSSKNHDKASSIRSSSRYSSPQSGTPISSKRASYKESDAVRQSADLSSHNFAKTSHISNHQSAKKSSSVVHSEVKEASSVVHEMPAQSLPPQTPPTVELPAPAPKHKIKRLTRKSDIKKSSLLKPSAMDTMKVKVSPVKGSKLSQNLSRSDIGISEILDKQRTIQGRGVQSPSNISRPGSHHSRTSSFISRFHTASHSNQKSLGEYDFFDEMRQFLQSEEQQFDMPRREMQQSQLMSESLMEVLKRVQKHIQIISFIAQVYDFETIYSQESQWLWQQIWLTLKRYLYQRKRIVHALEGGSNCFVLLGNIIDQPFLRAHATSPQLTLIKNNLQQCNIALQSLVERCQTFILKFSPQLAANPIFATIQTTPQQTGLLMASFYQQIERLLLKRDEEWGDRQVQQDESTYDSIMLLNERVYRLMQMGFAISNMSGRQIKPYQEDDEMFRDYTEFNNYLFHNQQQFKQMIKYFK